MLIRLLELLVAIHDLAGRFLAMAYVKAWDWQNLHWFDHRFDGLYGKKVWYWQERGVLGAQIVRQTDKVLDLCCGDGFYDRIYLSARAKHIDALDLDPSAIRLAKSQNLSENLHFYKQNVVTDAFPGTNYNLILCFSALQQLNDAELNVVFAKVKAALELKGTFFGSVSLIPQNAVLHTEEQVRNYLSRYFNITETYLSPWPKGRIECYFRCSAG
jgi:SAM-dependent methyltransferase